MRKILKIFKRVLLGSSLLAFSSATFAGSSKSFIPQKNESDSKYIFEKPTLIAETPVNYVDFDTLKITVTGTRTERAIKDVPGGLTSYDYDDINSKGSIDWRDLFKYDASISSQDFSRSDNERTYGTGDKGNINIRGVEGNRVLTLIDGIPIPRFSYGRNGTYAASRLNYIDFSTLGNVEVLKGPGSSLYGSDAMGGVVSLRSLEPDDLLDEGQKNTFEISSPYNSQNSSYQPSLKYAFKENDISGIFAISNGSYGELNRNTSSKYINDVDGDINSYYAKIIKKNGNTDFDFTVENISKDAFTTSSSYYNTAESLNNQTDTRDSKRSRISFGVNYKGDQDRLIDKFSAKIYSNSMENKSDYFVDSPASVGYGGAVTPAQTENTKVKLNQEMLGGNLQFTNKFNTSGTDQKLTYGFEINHNDASRLRDEFVDGVIDGSYKANPDSDILKMGFYLQDEIKFENWEIIAGIRYDENNIDAYADDEWYASGSTFLTDRESAVGKPISKNYSNWSPSIAVIRNVNNNLNIYGKYARGFRAPSWEDLNSSRISLSPNFSYTTIGNPNLKEETSDNFELGLKGRTRNSDFGISTFLNQYTNFLDKINTTGNVVFYQVTDPFDVLGATPFVGKMAVEYQTRNVFDVKIYGIEADYKYHFSERNKGLSFTASTSLVKGENETDNENLDSVNPFTAVTNFNYIFPNNKFSLSLTNTYVGVPNPSDSYKNPTNSRGQSLAEYAYIPDSYFTTDLALDYKASERFNLDLGIYNIFDTVYYKWSDIRANGISGSDDIAYQRYAQPGTSLKAGFRWRF